MRKRTFRKNRFIRRTGRRLRKRTAIRKKVRHIKTARSRYRKQIMPTHRGPYSKQSELKFVDFVQADFDIPFFGGGVNHNNALMLISDPNQFNIAQGTGRSQFTGQKINLLALDVYFKIAVKYVYNNPYTANNWPATQAEINTFNGDPENWNPKFRIVTMWDKRGKDNGTTPNNTGRPLTAQGFQANYDIAYWKIIEDKIYTLRPAFSRNDNNFGGYNGTMKTHIYFKKSFPIRQTAEMEPTGIDTFHSVNIDKRLFIVISTDAPWNKVVVAGQPAILPYQVTDMYARLWFKDP